MIKQCTKCKKILLNSDFNKRDASNDGLSSWCKQCLRNSQYQGTLYSHKGIIVFYMYNKDIDTIHIYNYITKSHAICERNRRNSAVNITHGLKSNGCAICGYNKCDAALDFHHVNPEDKKFYISNKALLSDKNIAEELNKCILLCCRCHREIHAKERYNVKV